MKKKIKRLLFPIYFLVMPQPNASYAYKFMRLRTQLAFLLRKLYAGNSYHLSETDIALRNRGDRRITLSDTITQDQEEILERYCNFIDIALLQRNTEKSILDVGAREGKLLTYLEKRGYKNVTGFEIVADWVNYCQQEGRTFIRQQNVLDIPDDHRTFDLVFSRHTLEHVDRTSLFFKKLVQLTATGGTLFVVFPLNPIPNFKHPSYLPSIEWVEQHFDFDALEEVTVCRLDALTWGGNRLDLVDEREGDEIVIHAQKK